MKERLIRILGNFGISFFTPLLGTQIVLDVTYMQSVEVALISAAIVTGVSLSREASAYGAEQNESRM